MMAQLSQSQRLLLVAAVANVDAVFTPYRVDPANRNPRELAAVLRRRKTYLDGGGLAMKLGGGIGRNRQQTHVDLAALQAAGLIRLHGDGARYEGVSLRRLDECLAHCPMKMLAESWPLLKRIAALSDSPETLQQSDFVLENEVLGKHPKRENDEDAKQLEADAMPLLIAGYLDTASDMTAHLGWKVTASGREALAADPPPVLAPLPPLTDSLCDLYYATLRDAHRRRKTWPDAMANDLVVPLSSGLWLSTAEWRKREARQQRNIRAEASHA